MKPHCSAMPWVPGIADFTAIPNMGVVLLSCTIMNATTRGKPIFYSSVLLANTDRLIQQ
jgi:hypothetical protein